MCDFFKVSRSGYYVFLKRERSPKRDVALATMIRQCQEKTRFTYGYRRVGLWLARQGVFVNHKAVLRIMNQYGLSAQIRRCRKHRQMGCQLYKYANLLNRDFSAAGINQKWVIDISYIKTAQGTLYLSVIIDLFDRSVVAYNMETNHSSKLVHDTVKKAIAKETVTAELQLHSDQGFQYTAPAYATLMKRYGITPSMSRRANCYDNAVVESFFGTLKSECLNRQPVQSIEEARFLIDLYMKFYNGERLQLKTKLTPLEKRRQFR